MKTLPHQARFTQHPLAQLAIAFIAGILTVSWFVPSLALSLSPLALFSLVTLLALLGDRPALATLSLLLTMFLAGASLAVLERAGSTAGQVKRLITDGLIGANDPVELAGVLDGPPEFARDRVYLPLRIETVSFKGHDLRASGTVALIASFQTREIEREYLDLDLHYGGRIRVMTTLDRSDKYRNPGVSTLTEYLDRKGYDATGFVKSPLLIERLEDERIFLPLAWLYDWRRRLQRQIDQHFSSETAGVLDAALLGNRYNLTSATAERFRTGGTFHVLVISGLHISFIGGIVFLASRRLTRKKSLQFFFLRSYSGAIPSQLVLSRL
jgi:competence protein ComEC